MSKSVARKWPLKIDAKQRSRKVTACFPPADATASGVKSIGFSRRTKLMHLRSVVKLIHADDQSVFNKIFPSFVVVVVVSS